VFTSIMYCVQHITTCSCLRAYMCMNDYSVSNANCYVNIQVRENGKEHKIIKKRKRLANGLEEVRVKKRPPG